MPFGANLMRSQELYWAAQELQDYAGRECSPNLESLTEALQSRAAWQAAASSQCSAWLVDCAAAG